MTDHELASGSNFTFETAHRHLEAYSRALESAGFLLEAIREPRTTPDAISAARGVEAATRVRTELRPQYRLR